MISVHPYRSNTPFSFVHALNFCNGIVIPLPSSYTSQEAPHDARRLTHARGQSSPSNLQRKKYICLLFFRDLVFKSHPVRFHQAFNAWERPSLIPNSAYTTQNKHIFLMKKETRKIREKDRFPTFPLSISYPLSTSQYPLLQWLLCPSEKLGGCDFSFLFSRTRSQTLPQPGRVSLDNHTTTTTCRSVTHGASRRISIRAARNVTDMRSS